MAIQTDKSDPGGSGAPGLAQQVHEVETRYETQLRTLQEENTRMAADLETRFAELGKLTRMMQDKQAEAEAEQAELRAHFEGREAELSARIAHLETELEALRNSTSWRVTRPLRWAVSRLGASRT